MKNVQRVSSAFPKYLPQFNIFNLSANVMSIDKWSFPKETYLSFSRVYNVFTHTHKHDSLIVNCETSKTYSKLVLETIEYNLNFLRTQYIHCEGQVMSDFHDMIYIHSIHCISDKRNMLQCRLIYESLIGCKILLDTPQGWK